MRASLASEWLNFPDSSAGPHNLCTNDFWIIFASFGDLFMVLFWNCEGRGEAIEDAGERALR